MLMMVEYIPFVVHMYLLGTGIERDREEMVSCFYKLVGSIANSDQCKAGRQKKAELRFITTVATGSRVKFVSAV